MTLAKPLALALALALAGPALASDEAAVPEATQTQIRTKLTAEGYDVRSIQMEEGEIEVYAVKDGKMLELYLDAALNVVRTKAED